MKLAEKTACDRVIWITGLSGAGKTTLARALLPHLPHAILLDGAEMREALGKLDGRRLRCAKRNVYPLLTHDSAPAGEAKHYL